MPSPPQTFSLNFDPIRADTDVVTNADYPLDQLRAVRAAPEPRDLPAPYEPFRIAVLCTGNRFRSPIAAAVIEILTEGLPVEVRSMGTKHVGTTGAMPAAIEAAGQLGVDVSGHRARLATPADVAHADLVLGFELVHLARARQLGAPISRVFTLPSLADVVEQLPYERMQDEGPAEQARRIVAWAHQNRDLAGTSLREIRDPVAQGARSSRSTAREVHRDASIVVGYLFDTPVRSGASVHGYHPKQA